VLPRQEFFTKEIHRLLCGGKVAVRKHSQSPVLPRTQRAYETCLSAGSTAVLADGHRWERPLELEPSPGMDFPSPASQVPQTGLFAIANCSAPNGFVTERMHRCLSHVK
jgi:hypothetical protein